jgi:hypothetical protein
MFAVNQTEELPQVPFQPRIGRQNEPPVASTPTDLNGVLEQLELFAPKNARHQYGENFTHRSKGSNVCLFHILTLCTITNVVDV